MRAILVSSMTRIFLFLFQSRKAKSLKAWSSWTKFGPCNDRCHKIRQRFCMAHDRTRCPGAGLYGIQRQAKTCSLHECYGKTFCVNLLRLLCG